MPNKKDKPLVTIVAASYNNAPFVLKTLESMAWQDYENTELIIIDDCSTDNSLSLIKEWIKELPQAVQNCSP